MAQGGVDDVRQDGRVERHDGTGDGGHAAGDDDEELRAGEALQVGADHQRHFGQAEKDARCRGDAHRAAKPKRAPQAPSEGANHPRQHAQMPEHRHHHAEDENLRQDAEREDGRERARRVVFDEDEGRRFATEEAEEQRRAGPRGRFHRVHHMVEHQQGVAHGRHLQEQEGERDLGGHADRHMPIGHLAPPLAEQPRDGQQRDDA